MDTITRSGSKSGSRASGVDSDLTVALRAKLDSIRRANDDARDTEDSEWSNDESPRSNWSMAKG